MELTSDAGGEDRSAKVRVEASAPAQPPPGTVPPVAGVPGPVRPPVRRPTISGTAGVLPVVTALLLSLVMQQLLNTTIPTDSYFFRLFRPAGGWFMGIVPALIAFVFIWTLTDLLLKLRTALANERDFSRREVKQLPAYVSQEPSLATLQRLRTWDRGLLARPVGRRMLWLLRHLHTVDAQRAHELVRHQTDVDADSAASSYRAVKLFIWAMPILGFIGTVLGISLAVGGFSDFLTTNVSIDEIDAVTQELGNVASGLSFAFDTTLLGLLAGLVANVVSSTVQGREERFITRLEELGLQVMAEASAERQEVVTAAPPVVQQGPSMNEIDELVRSHLETLSTEMDEFTYTVRRGLQSLNEASARISRGMEVSIESVNETMEQLGHNVNDLGQNVNDLGQNVMGTTARLEQNMAAIEEANRRLANTLSSIAPVLDQLTGPMEVRLMPQASRQPAVTNDAAERGASDDG
ncbi:MAG: MotA/TolQ/ExbB proton channel family protein [Gemmatimonadota bacterium]|nr:MotA/TolQ/ExbB proton channel family protein [Gemmatimonadota bacterium]